MSKVNDIKVELYNILEQEAMLAQYKQQKLQELQAARQEEEKAKGDQPAAA
jgi:hypothetical protein